MMPFLSLSPNPSLTAPESIRPRLGESVDAAGAVVCELDPRKRSIKLTFSSGTVGNHDEGGALINGAEWRRGCVGVRRYLVWV